MHNNHKEQKTTIPNTSNSSQTKPILCSDASIGQIHESTLVAVFYQWDIQVSLERHTPMYITHGRFIFLCAYLPIPRYNSNTRSILAAESL